MVRTTYTSAYSPFQASVRIFVKLQATSNKTTNNHYLNLGSSNDRRLHKTPKLPFCKYTCPQQSLPYLCSLFFFVVFLDTGLICFFVLISVE